jgi:hypothetical protein
LLSLLLIAAFIACCAGIVRYLGNAHVVDEGKLYRSARLERHQLEQVIRKFGIKSILNVRGEASGESWYENEISLSKNLHLTHFDYGLSASEFGDDRPDQRGCEVPARRPKADFGPL